MFRVSSAAKLLALAALLVFISASEILAQEGGLNHPTMRDRVRAITRAEMDRQLLLNATLPPSPDTQAAKKLALNQIREDFRELQALNNRMMAEAWAKPSLEYSFVSDMVARIHSRAARLKMNLNLPPPETQDKDNALNIANASDFRAALLVLDKTIMSFVSNPLFQKPNTIELEQGTAARRDLEAVIDLTDDLKRTASRLGKAHP